MSKRPVKIFQRDGQIAWRGVVDAIYVLNGDGDRLPVSVGSSGKDSVLIVTSAFTGFVVVEPAPLENGNP